MKVVENVAEWNRYSIRVRVWFAADDKSDPYKDSEMLDDFCVANFIGRHDLYEMAELVVANLPRVSAVEVTNEGATRTRWGRLIYPDWP
jgi:hypothetical protein